MYQMLKGFNIVSVCARLLLSLLAGGAIGFGRGRKKQTASLRTFIITCVGATLATLLGFYLQTMINGEWSECYAAAGVKLDGSRFASAVISGIGFLATGSIILIVHQQVSGLTTAIGLFITACIGIASGSGFYEAVILSVVFIVIVMEAMQSLEISFKRKLRNMTIHVDFDDMNGADTITRAIEKEGATIYEIEFEDGDKSKQVTSVIIWIKLARHNPSHSSVLSSVAELPCVLSVQELIS